MNVCARSDSEYDCVLILSKTCRTYSMIVGVPMIMSPPKEALRFHIFQVPERLYQLVDRSTDGLVTADQVMEFIAGLQAIR